MDAKSGGPPQLISLRQTNHKYGIEERNGIFYILTNANDTEDFKIVTAPVLAPGTEHWVDLVPHTRGVLILRFILLQQHLVRLERFECLPRIVVRKLESGNEWTVKFDEEAYSLNMWSRFEFDSTTIRFAYSSPTTPQRIYELDLGSHERILLKEQKIPSGHKSTDYQTKRIFATAQDGEQVPITLLSKDGLKFDGTAPCWLYGYGAYGSNQKAEFLIPSLSPVDRGVVCAFAHIRGGMDKGYDWYRNGRREHKVNTFTDFIATAEALVELGICQKGRIVACGGSAGGMLMGAVANMRLDLWAGVVATVPFVDVLNTILDGSLPLTPPEWPEWGNPTIDKAAYDCIAAYSPYEQVKAQVYPPLLVTAGLTDPRVTYWEPAKWVAKLRANKIGDTPIYLKTHMGAGHTGASGRFDRLKEIGLKYAFALKCLGLSW